MRSPSSLRNRVFAHAMHAMLAMLASAAGEDRPLLLVSSPSGASSPGWKQKYAPESCCVQALMPASVFVVGCGIGTESFNLNTAANMVRGAASALPSLGSRCCNDSHLWDARKAGSCVIVGDLATQHAGGHHMTCSFSLLLDLQPCRGRSWSPSAWQSRRTAR